MPSAPCSAKLRQDRARFGRRHQISYRHTDGRAYYERKLAEGKTPKQALRCLKRRVSDAVFAQLQADARRAAAGPG